MTIEQMIRFLEKHYDIISLERGSKFNSKKPNMWEVRVSNEKKMIVQNLLENGLKKNQKMLYKKRLIIIN